MKLIFAALVLMLSFGCSTIEDNPNTTGLIGFVATNEFIKKLDDEDDRAIRASKIIEVSRAAQRAAEGEIVTVVLVEEAVRNAVDWKGMKPADLYQANLLIELIGDEVELRVGTGVLKIDQLVVVDVVLENVIMAASFYAE